MVKKIFYNSLFFFLHFIFKLAINQLCWSTHIDSLLEDKKLVENIKSIALEINEKVKDFVPFENYIFDIVYGENKNLHRASSKKKQFFLKKIFFI